MINKKYLKNLRCKEINNKNDFIFDLYNERIIDSLDVINIKFKKILILGDQGSEIYKYIHKRFKEAQVNELLLVLTIQVDQKNSRVMNFL